MQLLRSGLPWLAKGHIEHTHVSIRGTPFCTEEVERRRALQDCGVGARFTVLDGEGKEFSKMYFGKIQSIYELDFGDGRG